MVKTKQKENSEKLKEELGNGFTVSSLQFMRRLFLIYQKQQTLSVKLRWPHYCELLIIRARALTLKPTGNTI